MLTTIREILDVGLAHSMLCSITGLPPSTSRFLRGIPLDPPRAGIIAMTFDDMESTNLELEIEKPAFSQDATVRSGISRSKTGFHAVAKESIRN